MTPQELFEYKRKWLSESPSRVQVDVDSHIWGKDWCRKKLERHHWSFDKYTQPDDSHTFSFEYRETAEQFVNAYREYNPRFPTEVI